MADLPHSQSQAPNHHHPVPGKAVGLAGLHSSPKAGNTATGRELWLCEDGWARLPGSNRGCQVDALGCCYPRGGWGSHPLTCLRFHNQIPSVAVGPTFRALGTLLSHTVSASLRALLSSSASGHSQRLGCCAWDSLRNHPMLSAAFYGP